MLPPELTIMASLLPGTDKLAVSIILEMSPDANVISHTFSQSIIHSCAQLHYSHAQVYFNLYIYYFLVNHPLNILNLYLSRYSWKIQKIKFGTSLSFLPFIMVIQLMIVQQLCVICIKLQK